MNGILDQYGELLQEVDLWFSRCIEMHPDKIACHHGCSSCCRGLFDITFMDALYLKRGIDLLDPVLREELYQKADQLLQQLSYKFPDFRTPWFLNTLYDEELHAMMPEDDPTPCLLLSENGSCLVYHHRPMTCRLNGIPLLDLNGEPFSDEWCTLNFINSDIEQLPDIRYTFNELFLQELLLFRELTRRIYGEACNEMDTIIPAVLTWLDTPSDGKSGFKTVMD